MARQPHSRGTAGRTRHADSVQIDRGRKEPRELTQALGFGRVVACAPGVTSRVHRVDRVTPTCMQNLGFSFGDVMMDESSIITVARFAALCQGHSRPKSLHNVHIRRLASRRRRMPCCSGTRGGPRHLGRGHGAPTDVPEVADPAGHSTKPAANTRGVRAQTAVRPRAHVPAKDVRRTRREVAQRHENGASGASVQGGGQHSGGDRRFDGRGSNCGATMESVMLPPTHPRCARHYGPVENTRERSKFWSSRANPSTLVVRFATIHKPREMTSGMA